MKPTHPRCRGACAALSPSMPLRSRRGRASRSGIVVPYPPGGHQVLSDIIARAASRSRCRRRLRTVIVENRAAPTATPAPMPSPRQRRPPLLAVRHRRGAAGDHARGLPPASSCLRPSKDLRGVTMLAYSPHLLVVHPRCRRTTCRSWWRSRTEKPQLRGTLTASIGARRTWPAWRWRNADGGRWTYIPEIQTLWAAPVAICARKTPWPGRLTPTGADERHAGHAAHGDAVGQALKVLSASQGRRVPLLASADHRRQQGVKGFAVGHLAGVLVPAGQYAGGGEPPGHRADAHHPPATGARAPGVAGRRTVHRRRRRSSPPSSSATQN